MALNVCSVVYTSIAKTETCWNVYCSLRFAYAYYLRRLASGEGTAVVSVCVCGPVWDVPVCVCQAATARCNAALVAAAKVIL